jgi:sialidase-1
VTSALAPTALGLILTLIAPATVNAAEPVRADLFVSGTSGYAVYRIPGIVATPDGILLAYAEARKTGASDWDGIDLVVRRSHDHGETWTPQQVVGKLRGPVAQNPAAASRGRPADVITYNNPIVIAGRGKGVVHFLFCVEYQRAFYMRSGDSGRTFSAPVEITSTFDGFRPEYAWKVLATGPGHGIELRNGRLIVPVWLSTSEGANAHRPSVVATVFSDDQGKTWRRGEIAVRHGGEVVNPSETAAEQMADGRVMLNVRSESSANRRIVVYSQDGASKWSAPRFQEELVEPVCFGSLVRYGRAAKGGANRLLFVHPDNLVRSAGEAKPGQGRDRRNLTMHLSEDDGATWPARRVIDPGWAGYADITVAPDGSIFCLYERGEPDAKALRIAALTLVRFELDWVKGRP